MVRGQEKGSVAQRAGLGVGSAPPRTLPDHSPNVLAVEMARDGTDPLGCGQEQIPRYREA